MLAQNVALPGLADGDIQLNEVKERYNRFVYEWKLATGGIFEGESVELGTILDDIHFIVYGFYPAE